jgi:3-deoxy-D-manno-octulosonic-acid transferase
MKSSEGQTLRRLYTAGMYLLLPFIVLRLMYRGIRNRGYWARWPERFGYFSAPQRQRTIWLHTVSVGEVQAALPLVRHLRRRYPERTLALTTMTPTGSQQAHSLFGEQVFHVYLPYDLPGAIDRFLDRIEPEIALIMETELWPNLIHGCADRNIPVIVANARLSARSARGYQRIGGLIRPVLERIERVLAQGQLDVKHFRDIGMPDDRVQVIGNLKFDVAIAPSVIEQAEVMRQQWGPNRKVWIAASTHEGEDEIVLQAFAQVRHSLPDCLLILVPRHPERFARVAALCENRGFSVARRSVTPYCPPDADIFLGDTLGELTLFYAASDVAFVGGSLVPTGGHNMLEPAALGLPVITGPHLFNFTEIAQSLTEAGGMFIIHDAEELAADVERLFRDPLQRTQAGDKGRELVEHNRGTVDRLLNVLETYLE